MTSDPDPADLLVVVGLTGVGKSTVLDEVLRAHPSWRLLPNRRELTDRIILPAVQERLAQPAAAVRDRVERFRLTAAYREMHPGGMAHALQGWLRQERRTADGSSSTMVFDNLRGLDEVAAAVDAFPGARFLLLDAIPATRLARLLERRDPFDRVNVANEVRAFGPDRPAPGHAGSSGTASAESYAKRLQAIPGAATVFDVATVSTWAAREAVDLADMERAARIIVEEQRNYDSSAARRYLSERMPPQRFLAVDTDDLSLGEVARRVLAWLNQDA